MGTRVSSFSWKTISEKDWQPYVQGGAGSKDGNAILRIFPGKFLYDEVVKLRYRGFIESGFIDPSATHEGAMRLERDPDSIILGMLHAGTLAATMTLNTITPLHPGLAMELEKKVTISHPSFRGPDAMEIVKLVVAPEVRGRRFVLDLLGTVIAAAGLLGKRHLWQVSRDVSSDISWRMALGFDYSNGYVFADPSLNGMPSRVGYLDLSTVSGNPNVSPFVKSIYGSFQVPEAREA